MLLVFLVYVSGLVSRYKLQSKFLYFSSCCETALFLFSEPTFLFLSLSELPLSLSFSVSVTTTASVCVCLLPRANMQLGEGGWGGGRRRLGDEEWRGMVFSCCNHQSLTLTHSLSSGSLSLSTTLRRRKEVGWFQQENSFDSPLFSMPSLPFKKCIYFSLYLIL